MVPCGKCFECRKRFASNWSFRLMQEYKVSSSGQFITLTYDTKHVPISPNGFMELRKRDLQLFFKRLRKAHLRGIKGNMGGSDTVSYGRIKYYAVGEYGGKTRRPHYHIILFNSRVELIQKAWDKGDVHYGSLTEASVGYTLKYVCKPKWKRDHKNDDRESEFSLMSKGLGLNYLTENMIKWHLDDLEKRQYVNLPDGKKASLPRYYRDKIYSDDQKSILLEANVKRNCEEVSKMLDKQTLKDDWNYREYKKKSKELLINHATKGRNKI